MSRTAALTSLRRFAMATATSARSPPVIRSFSSSPARSHHFAAALGHRPLLPLLRPSLYHLRGFARESEPSEDDLTDPEFSDEDSGCSDIIDEDDLDDEFVSGSDPEQD